MKINNKSLIGMRDKKWSQWKVWASERSCPKPTIIQEGLEKFVLFGKDGNF
jgi:hypothetical protein